ncbi:MAG: TldD/PmbA family protein [Bacillota bacterium]
MLAKSVLESVLGAAVSTGGDFAEVFVEDRRSTAVTMVGGTVERCLTGRDYGIGVRIFKDLNYVYAYTNDDGHENLQRVARTAAEAITGHQSQLVMDLTRGEVPDLTPIRVYPGSVETRCKVDLVRRAYHAAKGYHSLISQVRVNYMDEDQKVQIANTEGLLVEDRRVRTRTSIMAVASRGVEKQTGTYAPGASMGWEFYDTIDIEEYARDASRMAHTAVLADLCPGGRMPVIIANQFGGVIFHEACGHSLEATSVAKGTSEFAGKLGQKVASDLVTAVDDGTIPNAWGTMNVDDEGIPMQHKVLIEKGVLKGYMVDRFNGRRMQVPPTGSGRRQSYRFAPTSRMSNTLIAAGNSTPEEIIASTEYGLYAKSMGGGSVNTATGEFNFAVDEAYIVKNGRIDHPVRGATLIGRGSEVLLKIDMVAGDLARGQGMCGSLSGAVPTDVGQPTIRVSELTVGGGKGARS